MKWYIFQGADKQYYFHLRARNGKIVLQSEGYKRKQSIYKCIDSIEGDYRMRSAMDIVDKTGEQKPIRITGCDLPDVCKATCEFQCPDVFNDTILCNCEAACYYKSTAKTQEKK